MKAGMVEIKEHSKLVLRDVVLVSSLTGERRHVAGFERVWITHKPLAGVHTDESCWCGPILRGATESDVG